MAAQKLILNLSRNRIVCEHGAIADRPLERLRGLLGRSSLIPGEGLLVWPAPSIHTAGMRFAIDAVFVDRDLYVLKIVDVLRPWRVAFARRARGVLELAAGEAAVRGIEIGDRLGAFDLDWATIDGGSNGLGHGLAVRHPNTLGRRDPAQRPAKVLVLASDRRFLAVSAALLMRRGCAVTLAERDANACALAHKSNAEVVLLDADPSLTAAARDVAQLEALDPPVGVVVVSEDPNSTVTAMPMLAKWGSFETLCDAIESARPAGRSRGSHEHR